MGAAQVGHASGAIAGADDNEGVLLGGTVADVLGNPIAGVPVTLTLLYPRLDPRASTRLVAQTATNADGDYAFGPAAAAAAAAQLARWSGDRARLSYEVAASTPQGMAIYDLPLDTAAVVPVTSGTSVSRTLAAAAPRAESAPAHVDLSPGLGRLNAGAEQIYDSSSSRRAPGYIDPVRAARTRAQTLLADGMSSRAAAAAAVTSSAVQGAKDTRGVAPTATQAAAAPSCGSGYTLRWGALNKFKNRWNHTQVQSTRGRSKASYRWRTTKNTRLGIAITWADGGYSGGTEGSFKNKTDVSIYKPIGRRTTEGMIVNWRYRKWRAYCFKNDPPSTGPRALNLWKWRPHNFRGGNKNVKMTSNFECPKKYRITIDNATTVIKSQTATWLGWFAIAGVKLNASQTGSTEHTTVYDPVRRTRLCGKGADVLQAAFVREKAR